MKKKGLSLLLALAIMVSALVPAFAASASMENFRQIRYPYRSGQFKDVPAGAWYEEALKACYSCGLITGTTASAFDPNGNLTFGQVMVMAARLDSIWRNNTRELPAPAKGEVWYQPAQTYLMQKGLLGKTDFSDFSHGHGGLATREDMAFFFAKALPGPSAKEINTMERIPDVDAKEGNGGFVYDLYRQGVLTGSDLYGTYRPDDTITRAEAVVIMARVAFPEQRKTLNLHEPQTLGNMTFAVPVGSKLSKSSAALTAEKKGTYLSVMQDQDASYQGYSILSLSKTKLTGLLKNQLMQSAGADLALKIQDPQITAVKFGTVNAYRAVFQAENGPYGCAYFLISGDTLYVYMSMADVQTERRDLGNSVLFSGSAVSQKLA